jgi:DNA repair protein RadC
MYTPIAPPASTQDQVLAQLKTLFGAQAQAIFDSSNGSAITIIDMLRHKTGRKWEMLRAARGLHELALLEMAAKGPSMNAPAATRAFLKHYLSTRPFETFLVLMLNNRHQLITVRELFRGTIDGASVHPREVVREVLEYNAAACIFSHSHPSGTSDASQADELITRRLRDALSLIDVRVLDHIIVAGDSCLSFAERGLL